MYDQYDPRIKYEPTCGTEHKIECVCDKFGDWVEATPSIKVIIDMSDEFGGWNISAGDRGPAPNRQTRDAYIRYAAHQN